ncbi:MAG: hypothetical protein FJX25_02090 [Alphaproteobacteria bacterium]|nr:hypothetical protein [Alphaproteobacteria bacterium]
MPVETTQAQSPKAPTQQTVSPAPAAPMSSSRHGRVITDLKSFPFDVVGESNYQDALKEIAGGYRRDSQAFEMPAVIALDPQTATTQMPFVWRSKVKS